MGIPVYKTTPIDPQEFRSPLNLYEIPEVHKFSSVGKNGVYELRIIIFKLHFVEEPEFNLGFGLWNDVEKDIVDNVQTDNGDTRKILATVAHTALTFLKRYPEAKLFAEGSTPARTRLYQREILKVLPEIPAGLCIQGLIRAGKTGFKDFEKGVNYDGFLLTKRDNI